MRLIDVLVAELDEWPEGVKHYTCDPDGEIRAYRDIDHDFYPKNTVDDADRSDDYGSNKTHGTEVTRREWDAARNT